MFAADGEAAESGEGIEITVGNAALLVTKDGRTSAEMPLRDFEDGEIEALQFDRDAIRAEDGDRSRGFRKPS